MSESDADSSATISFVVDGGTIVLVQGDITAQRVDAIVNAANSGLYGGGGVDGAIHSAGGPSILAECRLIGGCPTGQAVVTGAGDLPCRHVIHTVGPVWHGGGCGEEELLASAYRASVRRAREIGAGTIAFPSLSTGAYGFPVDLAARVAVQAVASALAQGIVPSEVRFVLFDRETFAAFETAAEGAL